MSGKGLIAVLEEKKNICDTGITFIESSLSEEFLSYKGLYELACKALAYLQQEGLQPGDELVLQLDSNKLFIVTFWACLLGGIIPVPLTLGQNDNHRDRLFNVWKVLHNPYLAISPTAFAKLEMFAGLKRPDDLIVAMGDRSINQDLLLSSSGEGLPRIFEAGEEDTAFVQFSSGSTGRPKGVVLTHKNLLVNMAAISEAGAYTSSDAALSWMPLTHDMGLIGFHLNPLFCGMHQCLISTNLFIRKPSVWLDKATAKRSTILCSPNFGYEYVLKNCKGPANYSWNLSSVRILYNGAEPISDGLCRTFLTHMSSYGLRSHVLRPVYGLAEATLAVSFSKLGDEVQSILLDRQKVNTGDVISEKSPGQDAVAFVNVGRAVNDCLIRIADGRDVSCPDRVIGHIQIKGTNVTSGYYNNEEATRQAYTSDGWLKTGDLGFFTEKGLYITGREKDLLFVSGQNFYPHDLERIAEEVKGIELNKIAVAGYFNDEKQVEEAIAFIFHRGNLESFIPLARAVRELINSRTGVFIHRLVPVANMPRTTSGKLQRFRLLEQLRGGEFDNVLEELRRLSVWEMEDDQLRAYSWTVDEQKIREIWKQVLPDSRFGPDQSFFDIGGNSLRASEMLMLLQREFEVDLTIEQLYKRPTIEELAAEIRSFARSSCPPMAAAAEAASYPATSAQKRLYYTWQLDKASKGYNVPVAVRIKGAPSGILLERAIQKLISRHDCLRMSFYEKDGVRIHIHEDAPFVLEMLTCDERRLDEQLRMLIRPFDLTSPPLVRGGLIQTDVNCFVLFLDFHHIAVDGISVYHFLSELFECYAGKELPPLPARYVDYALWEEKRIREDKVQEQAGYWIDSFSKELPVLELPSDHHRLPVFVTEGGKSLFNIGQRITHRLMALASASGSTLHELLFTVYEVLLSKYSGQHNIVIGIPVAGRRHPDLRHAVGMFVNNLPIAGKINEEGAFLQLLQYNTRLIRQALSNQDYPFGDLIQRLGIKRDMSRNPLFDTMFIYQNMGFPDVRDSGFIISRHPFDPGFSKFDISLEIFEEEGGLSCGVEYAKSLFNKDTIDRMVKHFLYLLQQVCDHADSSIALLGIMDEIEHDLFVNRFNDTRSAYPADKAIHELFIAAAIKHPEAVALEYNGVCMTYGELNDLSDRLAILLQEKGIGPGNVAGIFLPRSSELIISILAVLKAGGCFLPLDTDLPDKRVAHIVRDSRCALLITSSENMLRTTSWEIGRDSSTVQVLSIDKQEFSACEKEFVPRPAGQAQLAYVIYTSGTTGEPKGVAVGHRSLVNYISWAVNTYAGMETVTFPLYTSISFDLTITSIFMPLVRGNKIIIYGEDGRNLVLENVIADNRVDIIKLTPSHLKILLNSRWFKGGAFSNIRKLIVGGENLETSLAAAVHELFNGNVTIYNEYGPTEATVGCMIHTFNPALDRGDSVPIGFPISNTQIYVLDSHLNPVPAGVKGEIYISGDCLAKGYLYKKDLTDRKFPAHPFRKGQKVYKTGDWARREQDGRLLYIGRADEQVKINGYRIELNEISSVLLRNKKLTQATVIVRQDDAGAYLCAYYVPAPGENIPGRELRHFLTGWLPAYMIPARLIQVDNIPLTLNGKVDTSLLPSSPPDTKEEPCSSDESELHEVLREVWKDVLGGRSVAGNEEFFELGGDSIKAVQISARLFEKDISILPKDILQHQSIDQLLLHHKITLSAPVYQQYPVEGIKAMTPIEYWFFGQAFADPGYYNQSVLLRAERKLDKTHLQTAFSKLIQHHDGLRLNWDNKNETLFFNNDAGREWVIEEHTIPFSAGRSLEEALEDICLSTKRSMCIDQGALLRAVLLKGDGLPDHLFITIHHLATDGITWKILLEDLRTAYLSAEKGRGVRLPAKTASLSVWHASLAAYAGSERLADQLSYWMATVAGFPGNTVPADHHQGVGNKVSAVLDAGATYDLLNYAPKVFDADVQSILLTALARTWAVRMDITEMLVEMEYHGRALDETNVSRTVGWFTTMYPFKLTLSGDDDPGSQVRSIRARLSAVPDNGMGYGLLKYIRKLPGLPAGGSEIRFNYLGDLSNGMNNDLFSLSDVDTGPDSSPANRPTAGVCWNCMILDQRLRIAVTYDISRYSGQMIDELLAVFTHQLHWLLEFTGDPAAGVPFRPEHFDAAGLDQEDLNALFSA